LWVIGRDEAELAAGFLHLDIAAGPPVLERDILERELFGQVAPEQRQRHVLVGAVLVDLAHRHGLDHGHVHALAMRPASISGISASLKPLSATALILIFRPAPAPP
jgi:hypothetical protein